MKKAILLKTLISLVLMVLFILIPYTKANAVTNVNALQPTNISVRLAKSADFDPQKYDPGKPKADDVNVVTKKVNPIIGAIKTLGIVLAVVLMIAMGLRYMGASVSEKADFKKTMIPYLIGAILVVALTQFLGVLAEIVAGIKT